MDYFSNFLFLLLLIDLFILYTENGPVGAPNANSNICGNLVMSLITNFGKDILEEDYRLQCISMILLFFPGLKLLLVTLTTLY